jgi:hypothetical protein
MRKTVPLLLALLIAAAPAAGVRSDRKDADLDFHFAWPALPSDVPRLEARLRGQAAAELAKRRREAIRIRGEDRHNGGGDPPRHSYEATWKIAAVTPRLLSLDAAVQLYQGGAHEGLAYGTLVWDRKTDSPFPLPQLFTDPAAAVRLHERDYSAPLRREKTERIGGDLSDFACPPLATQPVALTGRGGKIRGIEVLLQPYAVGSWAEGPYEVEVPITPAVRALVKAEFRGEF